MTRLMMTALVLFPAGASACETMAAMPAASGACGSGHGCGTLSLALMAAVAALGVWVLRSAEKDGSVVKWTGRVVGAVLVIIGLSGLLCGAVNHALKNRPSSCRMASGAPDTKLPPGHPPIGPSQK